MNLNKAQIWFGRLLNSGQRGIFIINVYNFLILVTALEVSYYLVILGAIVLTIVVFLDMQKGSSWEGQIGYLWRRNPAYQELQDKLNKIEEKLNEISDSCRKDLG